MKGKTVSEYEIQNMITQTQYVIDKGRKDISENKKELEELIMMKIERAIRRQKEKRRKKSMKKTFAILFLSVFLILFALGLFFVI